MSSKVDEDYVMGLIAGDTPTAKVESRTPAEPSPQATSEPVPQPKERRSRQKSAECQEYADTFLRKVEISNRQQLYIGVKTYDRLYEKVFNMGGRKASIGAFIECLLNDHFNRYKDVIEQIENNRKKQFDNE